MTDSDTLETRSPRGLRWLVAGSGILALAGMAAFWAASQSAAPDNHGGTEVTVTADACDPMVLSVPAGQASFVISNASDRPVEWEILDGVRVVAERENIAPGYRATLTERLRPGEYQITCGLLSNPRGTLTVTETAQSMAERGAPPLRDFIGPLSELRVGLLRDGAALVTATADLRLALASGDRQAAEAAYVDARAAWARLGPYAPLAGDLTARIAPRAEWLAGAEADADFRGFYRIEYGFWGGGDAAGMEPVAAELARDAAAFAARVKAADVRPEDIAGLAARYAGMLADAEAAGGMQPYRGDDRAELTAALASIGRAPAVLSPLLDRAAPETTAAIKAALDRTGAAVAEPDTAPDRRGRIAQGFADLAAALRAINPKLGLEG